LDADETQRIPIAIEDEMRTSFMDYAMSVIVSRALPDARDGLKPVHRRLLYAQYGLNNHWNRPYIKCARVVGDVLGKYHPHGDTAAYDALVRMAQDFSMRYPLIDGQGNFGSVDGDPAAAYRYTECRMTRLAGEMLADIDKETVNFQPNYDGKELEPAVMPTKVPNLLINGSAGIAVGMATNIPPHNLREIVAAVMALIENPALTSRELMAHVPGPDFPTAGYILGRAGIVSAYETGRGSIVMRAKVTEEVHPKTGRISLIVHELPFQVNKAKLIIDIADQVKDKRLEGISDLRDESDRQGMRMVIELKKDAISDVVKNNLFKHTQLQQSFGVINLAIVDGRPVLLTLRESLRVFIAHRREVVTRRTIFELREAKARAHILEGLCIALDHLDAVIALIRSSESPEVAKAGLVASFGLSPIQAQAILEMRLSRLTGLERDKIVAELAEVRKLIERLEEILSDEKTLMGVIVEELGAIRDQFGDDRRTEILEAEGDFTIEDMIADEDMVVTVTHEGYIKRNTVTDYRAQKRGGRGVAGAQAAGEDDFVAHIFVASTHDHLLLFTSTGRVFGKRIYEIPQAGRAAKGKALINLLELREGERVVEMLPIKDLKELKDVEGEAAGEDTRVCVMATRNGTIKKVELSSLANIRSSGIIGINLDEGDGLVAVAITDGQHDILLCTRDGYACRFSEAKVRTMGRTAYGVRGISLRKDDSVVGMVVIAPNQASTLLTVSERGYGKRTPLAEYPQKGRGGLGVITIKTSERNGKVVDVRLVTDDEDLMIITDRGKLIRMPVAGIPTVGRNTQGVRLIRIEDTEKVVAMESFAEAEGEHVADPSVVSVAELSAEASVAEEIPDEPESADDPADGDDEGGEA
jgi:DNA gyrase subunit A